LQLPRSLYESLPAVYAVAGAVALAIGYVLHSGPLSAVLSIGGLLALIGGTAVWLRRRDYRATQADLLRSLKDEQD
jgi:hypothetical protein